jgi:hypothetical protein
MDKTAELQDLQHHLRRSSDEPEEEDPPVSRPPRRMLDVRRLADSPIYRVPAKPWTTVTDDDDLVSHLVSLFFTWSFPYFCWIDRDAIISAMQSGDLSNPHCSPFLVNAILSEASVCHISTSMYTCQSRGSNMRSFCSVQFRLHRGVYCPRRPTITR